jgi:hypothetical protein
MTFQWFGDHWYELILHIIGVKYLCLFRLPISSLFRIDSRTEYDSILIVVPSMIVCFYDTYWEWKISCSSFPLPLNKLSFQFFPSKFCIFFFTDFSLGYNFIIQGIKLLFSSSCMKNCPILCLLLDIRYANLN